MAHTTKILGVQRPPMAELSNYTATVLHVLEVTWKWCIPELERKRQDAYARLSVAAVEDDGILPTKASVANDVER